MLGIGAIELERLPEVSDKRTADDEPRLGVTSAERGARGAARATPEEAAALFEAFGERIRRYVAFRVRSPEDADDLTSDVFRRVLSGPVPIDPGARPAWLFRVAHNAIIDHYRRRRFTIPLLGLLERSDDAPSLPDRAIRDEELRTVDLALARLVGRQRAAIYLRFYEDLEYADIATIMGVPAVTARTLVHRGLRKVAAQLAEPRPTIGGDR
jgi:RNA polymerase sigma-70 factor (ECF subfamily)